MDIYTELTDGDIEWIEKIASYQELTIALRWARRDGDDVYSKAIAAEMLKRSKAIEKEFKEREAL